MSRPRLLLVPEFTELTWTIKPQLAEWAEVASYDPPGVGAEPLPQGDVSSFTREVIVDRGLEELDRLGWERFFLLADSWAAPVAVSIAERRRRSVLGMAVGHAVVSIDRHGERPTHSAAVHDALTQLVHKDGEAFLRYGIAQSTAGSVSEELAARMVERFPKELLTVGWEVVTAEDDRFGEVLRGLRLPLLLAKHQGCLMSTDEGFEDAGKALPDARAISVPAAPSTSEQFGVAVREFCEEVSGRLAKEPAAPPAPARRPPRR
jgi:pimeloyl-ACP methyl ester carboxylesterase